MSSGLLLWIVLGGLLMSAIALVGSVTLVLTEQTLDRVLPPLIAFAAGTLIATAVFHLIPAGLIERKFDTSFGLLILAGFASLFVLEQFLHRHHCHRRSPDCPRPITYLILFGDGLHNFVGGVAVAGAFIADVRTGVLAWLAAAVHEVPQELGDIGILVHGGWGRGKALMFNVLSGLTFLVGALVTYFASRVVDVSFLLPFAAGNFLYIGAADLVPEVRGHPDAGARALHVAAFALGVAAILVPGLFLE